MKLWLDYATFNFAPEAMSWHDVGMKLAGGMPLKWVKAGISHNAPQVSPFGLRWMDNNGYAERPRRLDVSGVGCRKFLLSLPVLRDKERQHFSRLDFAFDVIMSRSEWVSMIKSAFMSSLDSERQLRKYSLTGTGEAMTLYIGSRKSAKFFRVYNKTLQDKAYTFVDDDGEEVPLPEGYYVIRYEVELKRRKSTSVKYGVSTFDPSPAFDWYYGAVEDQQKLVDFVLSLWEKFCPEEYLPDASELAEMKCATYAMAEQKSSFCSIPDQELYRKIRENVHKGEQTFSHTMQYVLEKFGKYVPYMLADASMRQQIFDDCAKAFGFEPDYYFECSLPAGWNDFVSVEEVAPDEYIPEQFYIKEAF